MAGFGAHAASKKLLGLSADRRKQAERLRLALGGLKGPLMKVGQIMASIPDLVPQEYAAELAQLQADAPSMGVPFVRRRMKAELGADWEKKFKSFDLHAAAAASLGQVHKAVALDGETLACKLQYPDMETAVDADLRQLKIVLALFELYDRAVSTDEVQKELAERFYEELDYIREAKHIKLYGLMHATTEGVHIPRVYDDLSTQRLLSMTWLEGERLASFADSRDLDERNIVAANMFHAWYTPFYRYGVIHGDPHMGNYTIRKDLSLNLLDFGCVRIFKPELIKGILLLYNALSQGREDDAVEAYEIWGFKNPSKRLIEILNIWARFIYAPLLEDKARPIDETNTGLYGRETANRVHAELRTIGGVMVPREFVFMDRAAIGLGAVFLRLRASINWYRIFHDVIDTFDVRAVRENQKKGLEKSGLS
ncbi:MAG: AarF/ABC1/UbiB kinase family protein [Alphaproteobacteria bacterium]|nr:AarF/ABC1/UbiB kinase family protein [Alphaproteobacteria bacterium]